MRYPASEKARDHPPGRAVASAGAANAGEARHPESHVLSLVRSLPDAAGLRLWATVRSRPDRVWNRIPEEIRSRIVDLALDAAGAVARASWRCASPTSEKYFVSEASVYRLLKAHDLITSPAFIVIKAADEFKDKTTAPNQLWQTDFTYLKVTGWGWYYLSTVLDDFSRYIVAWKLCTTMQASDVTDTLDLALAASGLDQITVAHRPRLLSDNGASYIAGDLAEWLDGKGMAARPRRALPSADAGQDRALASDAQEPHPARALLSARRSRGAGRTPSSSTTTMPATTRA